MIKKISKFIFTLTYIGFELFVAFIVVLFIYIIFSSRIGTPEVPDIHIAERTQVGPDHYTLGNNWLRKNKDGIWEMYIEGNPYERGLVYGKLAKELCQEQEEIFVAQIDRFVPNEAWQNLLRLMLGFFNKDLPANIPLENQQEIFGISQSFSDEFDYIASKYSRILNYHAAHDIGHALNDYQMVGCTSFSLKDSASADGQLLVGRNFDFYVGDAFAKEKLILFLKPEKGYPFASYSWAGFTGVVSGLNNQGLSVTINASKSDLPTSTKTPISLLAREILQYASTIDEAIAIAEKRQTFVSETIMVNSKKDRRAVLIEKSPTKMGVYAPDGDVVICANHYQSDAFVNDPTNIENISESDSKFRYDRVQELLAKQQRFTPNDAAFILRNQLGANNDTLGMGNPRAINQLLAHHSVVIQPEDLRFYISTQDHQLGRFIGYDLGHIFANSTVDISSEITADPFVYSEAYASFKSYKSTKQQISDYLLFDQALDLSDSDIAQFIASNSELYITYEVLGRYFQKKGQSDKAASYFELALTKNVASQAIRDELSNLIKECRTK